jgi:nucleoid-associated protein YgaU
MPRQQTALLRVSVTLSTIVVGLVLLLPATGNADVDTDNWDQYVVHAGDTLWEIAAAVTPEGDDVRKTIAEIRSVNGLSTSLIVPGQELRLPPD